MTVQLHSDFESLVVDRHVSKEGVQIAVKFRTSNLVIVNLKFTPGELDLWANQISYIQGEETEKALAMERAANTNTREESK